MNRQRCSCGKLLVNVAGPQDASILLLGDVPSYLETTNGYPFVVKEDKFGRVSSGMVLQQELGRAGLQMGACRATYLWRHEKNDCDINKHKDWAAQEIAGRSLVIVMGTEPVQAFFDYKISDVSGLVLEHDAFSGTKFFCMPSPFSVFNSPIGEMRFAMKQLKEIL